MYNTIHTSRIYEKIIEQIRKLILDGELEPGDKLPSERKLADQFGVSRTAVREAVKALCERGMIEIQPGRGTYVANFEDNTSGIVRDSLQMFMQTGHSNGTVDLIQVRAILEPEIAALAAENASADNLLDLTDIVRAMDGMIGDQERFVEADLKFHMLLAQATQNTLIPVLINPIVALLREQRKQIFTRRGGSERGQIHHRAIMHAILARDPEKARQAMADHIQQVTDDSEAVSAEKITA